MRCQKCYKRISDDCDFCPYCGHQIIKEKLCPKCGAANDVSAIFCKKCGTKLVEEQAYDNNTNASSDNKETPPTCVEHRKKSINKNFLSIFAMSTMIFSIAIMFLLVFTPFYSSSFYPNHDFTIIGWASNILKIGAKSLFEDNRYLDFINAIVMLTMLASFVILCGLLFGLSLPKFIRNIKQKTYYSFSRRVGELYVLFLAIYIYFTRFVMNIDKVYVDSVGFGVMFIVIAIPLLIIFNNVVKTIIDEEQYNIKTLLIRGCSSVVTFVLLMIAINCIGGDRFFLKCTFSSKYSTTTALNATLSNLDLATFFINNAQALHKESLQIIVSSLVYSGIAFVLEILILVFLSRMLVKTLSSPLKRQKYVRGIVVSSITSFSSIIVIVMNTTTLGFVNKINSLASYGASIVANSVNTGLVVGYLLISLFLLANNIALLVIDKEVKDEEVSENE